MLSKYMHNKHNILIKRTEFSILVLYYYYNVKLEESRKPSIIRLISG